MLRLIKAEFIKNKTVWVIALMGFFTTIISIFINNNISNLIADYVSGSLDAYIFIMLCQVQLLLCLPLMLLLVNSRSSFIEEKNNGWGLILSNAKSIRNVIRAKYFVNIISTIISYIVITVAGSSLLWERGIEVVVQAVLVPMTFSFICFIPFALLIQIICILINNVIGKLFFGIFIIMASFISAQTEIGNYILTVFPYSIATQFEFVIEQLALSIFFIILVFSVGVSIIERSLKKNSFE